MRRALASLEAGLAYAEEQGVKVAIAVVDSTSTPVAAVRMDGSYQSTYTIAVAKAHTALNFRRPTDEMAKRIKPENQASLMSVEPRLIFLGGGRPALLDGVTVGAVGVSGASEAQDTECARLVIERFES